MITFSRSAVAAAAVRPASSPRQPELFADRGLPGGGTASGPQQSGEGSRDLPESTGIRRVKRSKPASGNFVVNMGTSFVAPMALVKGSADGRLRTIEFASLGKAEEGVEDGAVGAISGHTRKIQKAGGVLARPWSSRGASRGTEEFFRNRSWVRSQLRNGRRENGVGTVGDLALAVGGRGDCVLGRNVETNQSERWGISQPASRCKTVLAERVVAMVA